MPQPNTSQPPASSSLETASLDIANLASQIAATGLMLRGLCAISPDDGLPPGTSSLALIGFAGREGWPAFASAPEASDHQPDPLDRWSKRIIGTLAKTLNALPLFPSDGPPYIPFQRLALRAGPYHPSPLGLLIDPAYGLWHSFRGALAFTQPLPAAEAAQMRATPSPCATCETKPCLSACPVGAFTPHAYDVPRCAAHLHSPDQTCTSLGCAARLACPIGQQHRYAPDQMRFYMAAFKRSHPL